MEIFNELKINTMIFEKAFDFNRLQFACPVGFEKWNAVLEIPSVTFCPVDIEKSDLKQLNAINADGENINLDTKVKPDSPVIVISYNERTDELGQLKDCYRLNNDEVYSSKTESTQKNSYKKSILGTAPSNLKGSLAWANKIVLTWDDNSSNETKFIIERGYGGSFITIGETTANINHFTSESYLTGTPFQFRVRAYLEGGTYTSYSALFTSYYSSRDARNNERLTYMKYTDLSEYEGWMKGAPETRVIVANGSGTLLLNGVWEPNKRSDIDNTWWNPNIFIDYWNPDLDGYLMSYKFFEEDWSTSTTSTTVPYYNNSGTQIGTVTASNTSSDKQEIGLRVIRWYYDEGDEWSVGSGFVFKSQNIGSY